MTRDLPKATRREEQGLESACPVTYQEPPRVLEGERGCVCGASPGDTAAPRLGMARLIGRARHQQVAAKLYQGWTQKYLRPGWE